MLGPFGLHPVRKARCFHSSSRSMPRHRPIAWSEKTGDRKNNRSVGMQFGKAGIKGTVLIGEDDPEVRNYLSMALECFGYDVAVADDGSEVVNFVRSANGSLSALLLDIVMPRMDGIQAVREIRKTHA